jgi:prepilin-type N-terminal cleavage/methylation domain-containing protein
MLAARRRKNKQEVMGDRAGGFTLVELLVVIIIIAALVVICLPRYFAAVNSAWVRECQSQIRIIDTSTQAFFTRNHKWPTNVEEMVQGYAPSWVVGVPLTSMPECPFGVPYRLEPVLQDGSTGQPTSDNPQMGVVVNAADHFENGEWINALRHKGSAPGGF